MVTGKAQARRVLSIQSSVVSGHVGNKAAVFPLQLLGWDVDPLNTVQFSNHTGPRYGKWGGDKMTAEHLAACFDALDANGLVRYSHLLTGYTPTPEALEAVGNMVARLRQANPDLVYLLDPVMGDDGKLYVSPEVPPLYKRLLSQATCTTPNDFEASQLTGISVTSLQSLSSCLTAFHAQYSLPHVVISSVALPASSLSSLGVTAMPQANSKGRVLVCGGSSQDGDRWCIPFPELEEHYEGVGDLFSALLLARFPGSSPCAPSTLREAAELAIASLQGVLAYTRRMAVELSAPHGGPGSLKANPEETPEERVQRLRSVELKLVASREAIEHPEVVWRAFTLS